VPEQHSMQHTEPMSEDVGSDEHTRHIEGYHMRRKDHLIAMAHEAERRTRENEPAPVTSD
jgi:hypothetical protein